MIKLVCFIRKRSDLDRDAFRAHWRDTHGPLIANLPMLRRHLIRYEQNHRLEADYARDDARSDARQPLGEYTYDGSTIMWFESMETYAAFAAEPDYAEHIAPDEMKFMDRRGTMYFFTEPEDVKFGGAPEQAQAKVKLLALLKRRPGLSIEDFHRHWSGPHARIFLENPPLRDHILAYQQNHRFEADYERDPSTTWDGLAEQWYESLDAFHAGAAGKPFEELVVPDEEQFMNRRATRYILTGRPEVIVS